LPQSWWELSKTLKSEVYFKLGNLISSQPP
jgi:hypothetical protein